MFREKKKDYINFHVKLLLPTFCRVCDMMFFDVGHPVLDMHMHIFFVNIYI